MQFTDKKAPVNTDSALVTQLGEAIARVLVVSLRNPEVVDALREIHTNEAPSQHKRLLTIKETAQYLGVSECTARTLLKDCPAAQLSCGHSIRVNIAALEDALRERGTKAARPKKVSASAEEKTADRLLRLAVGGCK